MKRSSRYQAKSSLSLDTTNYVNQLREYMAQLALVITRPQHVATYIQLKDCTRVCFRTTLLASLWIHPTPDHLKFFSGTLNFVKYIITYFIDKRGKKETISVDRLKVAALPATRATQQDHQHISSGIHIVMPDIPNECPVRITRSGRQVHWPNRLGCFKA